MSCPGSRARAKCRKFNRVDTRENRDLFSPGAADFYQLEEYVLNVTKTCLYHDAAIPQQEAVSYFEPSHYLMKTSDLLHFDTCPPLPHS